MTSRFSTALRAAITTSGHSLDALSQRLGDRGTPAGVSTLSSWQTGVNHPERRSSLAALAGLEELLGLQPRALRDLLPPRRPRGAWRAPSSTSLPHQRMWRSPEAVERVLAKLDAVPADLYVPSRISRSVKLTLDAEGHAREAWHRVLLRCETETANRLITLLRTDALPQPPSIVDTEGCHLGRMRADVPGLLSAFELVLDQPMSCGDLRVVEFALRHPPGQTECQYDLRVSPGVRDLSIQVRFDPDRPPNACCGFYEPAQGRRERILAEADVHRSPPRFQFVVLDPSPGIYGVRWEWG